MTIRSLAVFAQCLFCPLFASAHGELHERIAAVTAQITSDSLNGELYLKRGQLYLQHGEHDEAIADLRSALALDEDLVTCHLGMAEVYLHREQLDSGFAAVNIFLANYPTHPIALQTRAELFQRNGDHTRAVQDLQELVATAVDCQPEYYIELSHATQLAYPDLTGVGIAALEQGIEKFGFVISLYDEVINVAAEDNLFEVALRYTDQVIEQLPRKELWLVKKARLLMQADKSDEALAAYHLALEYLELLPEQTQRSHAMTNLRIEIETAIH